MSQKPDDPNPFDPMGMFKSMRDTGMDTWSKMMIQVVNSEAYAQANAAMLDAWLTTSAPFRKAIETTMTQVLTQLNMPTRADVSSLAERLTNIEMRLDDLETKLDDARDATPKQAPRASRTRPAGEEQSP
jgi:polyhydroxyalkanoic acid synthase PhaR subunit